MGCYKACFTCEHFDESREKTVDGLPKHRCKRWSKWVWHMFCCEAHKFKIKEADVSLLFADIDTIIDSAGGDGK